jgi:hypothetical protein
VSASKAAIRAFADQFAQKNFDGGKLVARASKTHCDGMFARIAATTVANIVNTMYAQETQAECGFLVFASLKLEIAKRSREILDDK